jgi:hypothetical protein
MTNEEFAAAKKRVAKVLDCGIDPTGYYDDGMEENLVHAVYGIAGFFFYNLWCLGSWIMMKQEIDKLMGYVGENKALMSGRRG